MGGDLVSRAYEGDADLLSLVRFVAEAGAVSAPQSYLHPGDVVWGMFQNTVFDPRQEIRLWERDGELVGFAVLEEPDGVLMQAHPRLRGAGVLEKEMLRWAAGQTPVVYGEGAEGELWTRAPEDEPRLDALLTGLGFARDGDHALKMLRGLEGPLPDPALPDGWIVREVGGEAEWGARVEVHREVWPPSRVTMDAYRRLRLAPGYDPRLDLVAVGPDGALGAYCICWFDPVGRTGLFEPVGTRAAYRRMGLGKAVMAEGLRRLRDGGAGTALVTALHENKAAAALYGSLGFRTVNKEWLYGKSL